MVAIIGNHVPLQQVRPVATEGGLGGFLQSFAGAAGNRALNDLRAQQLETEVLKTMGAQREFDAGQALSNVLAGGDFDPRAILAQGVLAGRAGGDLGNLVRALAANTMSVDDPRVSGAMLGAGDSFSSTPVGFGRDQARQVAQNEATIAGAMERQLTQNETALELQRMKEAAQAGREDQALQTIMAPGPDGRPVPTLVRRGDAVGQAPLMSLDQTRATVFAQPEVQAQMTPEQVTTFALGGSPNASERRPGLWIDPRGGRYASTDGLTDIRGNPLPPDVIPASISGGAEEVMPNVDRRQLLLAETNTRQVVGLLDTIVERLGRPDAASALGPIGGAANVFNNVRSQLEAFGREIGIVGLREQVDTNPQINATLDRFMSDPGLIARARQLGVEANVLRSQILDLAYVYAVSREPGGRLSDQDVARAVETVAGSSMDPNVIRQTLLQLRDTITRNHDIRREVFREFFGTLPGAAPDGAPAAPAAQTPTRRRFNPETGALE